MTVRTERLRTRGWAAQLDLQRFLSAALLGGYGIVILSLFFRHVMSLYINPVYIGPTSFAGAVLLGLALIRMTRGGEEACGDGCSPSKGCEHRRSSLPLRTYAVLSLPLLLAIAFPPRGLAAFSATQRGPQVAGMTAFHGATNVRRVSLSVDTSSFSLQDWVGALSADPNPRDYLGKRINLTGLVIHNPASVPPGYIMVLRYQVTCCVADARPVGLVVKDTSNGALKDNQWVTVRGTMGQTTYQGQKIAVVEPKLIAHTKAGDPYMY